jgi:hypothetical protein
MTAPVTNVNVHRLQKHERTLKELLATVPKSSGMAKTVRRMLRETRAMMKTHRGAGR